MAAPGGKEFMMALLEECRSVAEAQGQRPREASIQRAQTTLTAPGSPLTASMLRDIEHNAAIEADHIVGDMLRRGKDHGIAIERLAHLTVAFTHLKAYEARREKELKVEPARSDKTGR